MSNLGLIIEERSRDIGDFLVGRLLPFRKKRMIGPFIFLDHMGPKEFGPGERMDIGPHPHLGLSTLTYLLDGEIVHRDSLGSLQRITPGAVNWMTAGRGIVHSERSPDDLETEINRMHGLQIWVALPVEKESMSPEFHHIEAERLPEWQEQGGRFKLIAGEAKGRRSPVPVHSELFLLELISGKQTIRLSGSDFSGELGIYILAGAVKAGEEKVKAGNLLLAKDEEPCHFEIDPGSHLFLLGGKPFPEKRHIVWNFVSADRAKIDEALRNWDSRRYPEIPGDDDYVPLPPLLKESLKR